jgi:dynactin complex subunit
MKLQEFRKLIREEIRRAVSEANKFAKFSDLEQAIKHHEKGNTYYDETKLISLFNQLSSSDQIKARTKYKKYFKK